MDKVEKCPYCGMSYPHQGPTGCLTTTKPGAQLWSSDDPYVIWPYYTGRDKGLLMTPERNGIVPIFFNEGRAWKYIFDVVQPDDPRACDNYRVLRVSEYMEAIRRV